MSCARPMFSACVSGIDKSAHFSIYPLSLSLFLSLFHALPMNHLRVIPYSSARATRACCHCLLALNAALIPRTPYLYNTSYMGDALKPVPTIQAAVFNIASRSV